MRNYLLPVCLAIDFLGCRDGYALAIEYDVLGHLQVPWARLTTSRLEAPLQCEINLKLQSKTLHVFSIRDHNLTSWNCIGVDTPTRSDGPSMEHGCNAMNFIECLHIHICTYNQAFGFSMR